MGNKNKSVHANIPSVSGVLHAVKHGLHITQTNWISLRLDSTFMDTPANWRHTLCLHSCATGWKWMLRNSTESWQGQKQCLLVLLGPKTNCVGLQRKNRIYGCLFITGFLRYQSNIRYLFALYACLCIICTYIFCVLVDKLVSSITAITRRYQLKCSICLMSAAVCVCM